MGRLIVTEFMSLDGVGQAPGRPDEDRDGGFALGGWQAPFVDAAAGRSIFAQASRMDALLLGRRTYDIFAGYWPTAAPEIPFTKLFNDLPKYVASRNRALPVTWAGTTHLVGDLTSAVGALTARHDRVHVIGSLDLVQSLLAADLVDEFDLWVYPLVLGSGKRVFAGDAAPTTLRLLESRTYPNGAIHARYERSGVPLCGTISGEALVSPAEDR